MRSLASFDSMPRLGPASLLVVTTLAVGFSNVNVQAEDTSSAGNVDGSAASGSAGAASAAGSPVSIASSGDSTTGSAGAVAESISGSTSSITAGVGGVNGAATGSVGGTGGGAGSTGAGGASVGGASTGGAPSTGGAASGSPVTWPLINGVQWADTQGNPIQAHGGGMLKVGQEYYWFGENRNPDGTFYAVSAYRSRDLRQWEHVNDVLTMNSDPGLSPANIERPKVVYNATTQQYVMWMHWEDGMDYGEARAAVASSNTVDGDYSYHGSFRPYQDSGVMDHDRPGYMSRDCTYS